MNSGFALAVVPVALALIMLTLGLSLKPADFRRVLSSPRALGTALIGQLLLLPVLGVLVARASGLDTTFALGIVVLSLCPGGALSNALCAFARADLALSVSATAFSSLVTPFSLPILYGWAAQMWGPVTPNLSLPMLRTVLSLACVTVVPIAVGMAIRQRAPKATTDLESKTRMVATALFAVVVVTIVAQNSAALRTGLLTLGAPLVILGIGASAVGLATAWMIGLTGAGIVTVGIEVGMQNIATATFVCATLLGDATMALVPAAYAFVMLPIAGMLAVRSRRLS